LKKKTLYINIAIIAVVTLILLGYMFLVDGFGNLISALGQAKLSWLVGAVLMIVIYWIMETLSVFVLAKKLYPKHRLKHSLKTVMIGQLFNCITPFATGGQPMQVFILSQRGMPAGLATLCLFARFIVYQTVLTILSIIALILRLPFFIENVSKLGLIVLIGFIVNFAVVAALFSVAFFPNASKKIAISFVRFLGKIKIIKKTDKLIKRTDEQVSLFYEHIKQAEKYIGSLIKMSALTVVQLIAYFSIPFFIFTALGISGMSYFDALYSSAFVLMVSSFVPLPGAALGAEGSFLLFFNMYSISDNFTAVAMLLWRFITFYIPIITGMFFLNRLHKIDGITIMQASQKK